MLKDVLVELYDRDLKNLRSEIERYENESDLWKTNGEIANSGGNLCLHLLGNLNHFIGAVLGNSGYRRDRDAEFSTKSVPRTRLLADIDATVNLVFATLDKISEEELAGEFPIKLFERTDTTAFMLVHLATHLNYHLGQINYHRRLLSAS